MKKLFEVLHRADIFPATKVSLNMQKKSGVLNHHGKSYHRRLPNQRKTNYIN